MGYRQDKEQGSVTPLAVCMVFVLFAVAALGVDFAIDYAMAIDQNSNLQIAREETISAGSGFVLKNVEEPGKRLAKQTMESIRKQGYTGKIVVQYWEAPKGWTSGSNKLPDDKRLIVYGISIDGSYATAFARVVGIDTLPVRASDVFSIVPYSQGEAWRPASCACGTYTLAENKNPVETSLAPHATLSSFPQAVQDEAARRLASI